MTNHSWTNRSKESLSVSHDKPLLNKQVKRIIVSQSWQTTPEQTGQKNHCQSVMTNHSWTNRSKESLSVSHDKPLLNKQVKRIIVSQSWQTTPEQTGQKNHCQSVMTNHSWTNRSKESLSVSHDKPLLNKQVKRIIVSQSWQTTPEQTGQKNHCQSVMTNHSWTNRSKESLSVSHDKPLLNKQVKRIIVSQSWQTTPEQTGQKNHCQSGQTTQKQVKRIIVSQSWQTTPEQTGQKNHCQSVMTNHSWTNRSKESLSVSHDKPLLTNRSKESLSSHDKPLLNKQVKRIIVSQSWQTTPEQTGEKNHCQSVMTNHSWTNRSKESLSVSHDKPLQNKQVKRIIVSQSWQTTPEQTGQKNHCQSVMTNHSRTNRSKESLSVSQGQTTPEKTGQKNHCQSDKPLLNKQVKRIKQSWQTTPEQTGQKNHCQSVMTNHSWTNRSKESLSVSHDKPLLNKQVKRIIVSQSWQTTPEQTGQKNHCQSFMTNHSRTNRSKGSLSVSHDKPLLNKQVKRIIVSQSWQTTPEQTGQKNHCQSVMTNHSWTNRSKESLSVSHDKPLLNKQVKRIIVSQSWQTTPEQTGQKNHCQSHDKPLLSKVIVISHDKPLLNKQVKRIIVSQSWQTTPDKQVKRIIVSQSWQTTPEQTGQKNHCQSVMTNQTKRIIVSQSWQTTPEQVKRIIVSQSWQTTPEQTGQKNHCQSVMTNHSWINRSKESLSVSHDKPLLNKQVKRIIVSQSWQTTPEQTGQKNHCQSVMTNHSWTNRSKESLSVSHDKPLLNKQVKRIIVSQSWQTTPEQTGEKNHCQSVMTNHSWTNRSKNHCQSVMPNHSRTNRSKESLSVSHDKPLLNKQVKRIIVSQSWQTTPEQTGQKNHCQSVRTNHSRKKQVKRIIVSHSWQTTPEQTDQRNHCQSVMTNHSWTNRSKESLSVSHDKPLLNKQVKRIIVSQSWQTTPEQTG